jgi:hypothetical protein
LASHEWKWEGKAAGEAREAQMKMVWKYTYGRYNVKRILGLFSFESSPFSREEGRTSCTYTTYRPWYLRRREDYEHSQNIKNCFAPARRWSNPSWKRKHIIIRSLLDSQKIFEEHEQPATEYSHLLTECWRIHYCKSYMYLQLRKLKNTISWCNFASNHTCISAYADWTNILHNFAMGISGFQIHTVERFTTFMLSMACRRYALQWINLEQSWITWRRKI